MVAGIIGADMGSINIRSVTQQERGPWEQLWQGYLEFYESTLTDRQTAALWQRIHDPQHEIQCRVAADVDTAELIGLVHFFPHVTTWKLNPVCYLNDLYVSPAVRGGGTGEALIKAVVDEAGRRGWEEVYWLTQAHNTTARGLYDKLTGGSEGFVNYSIDTSG